MSPSLPADDASESSVRVASQLTLLSWRRTALRWVVVAGLGARLLGEFFGTAAVVAGGLAVLLGFALHLSASATYRAAVASDGTLTTDGYDHLARARLRVAALAAATGVLGASTLAWVWFG